MKVHFLAVFMVVFSIIGCRSQTHDNRQYFQIHPGVFEFVMCRISDTEEPVVTEINLDAVQKNRNQFHRDDVSMRDGWITSKRDGGGFLRYKILDHSNDRYLIECQDNGGGSCTSSSKIGFEISNRMVIVDNIEKTCRVLKVVSIQGTPSVQ